MRSIQFVKFFNFPLINLVFIDAVTSQLIVCQVHKCDVQGFKAIDVTIGDHYVHLSARLVAFIEPDFFVSFEKGIGEH